VVRAVPWSRLELRHRIDELSPFFKILLQQPDLRHLQSPLQLDIDAVVAGALADTLISDALLQRRPAKLIILPDDVLCTLPYDLLLTAVRASDGIASDGGDPAWFPAIQTAFAVEDVLSAAPRDSAQALLMANGLPATLDDSASTMLALPQAVEEVKNIARELPCGSTTLLCNEEATRRNFLDRSRHSDLLHFAMHAEQSALSSDYGRLYLGSADGRGEVLYGFQISRLQLRANLAVLSACKTALGSYRRGFGLQSLVLSFMDAGVPSVVASFWQVEEEATRDLMEAFHQNVAEGATFSAALAAAKQHLKRSERYSDPYYWAGFQLYGKDGQLSFQKTAGCAHYHALAIAGVAIFGFGFYWWVARRRHRLANASEH